MSGTSFPISPSDLHLHFPVVVIGVVVGLVTASETEGSFGDYR